MARRDAIALRYSESSIATTRAGLTQIEVGGQAGVGDRVEPLRQLRLVRQHDARRRATEGLVGRVGHQVGALGQGLLERPANDLTRQLRARYRCHALTDAL